MKDFADLIFYEIYPTSFYDSNGDGIGDLKGIEDKLEYVKDLGFNAIWLNPFYKSPFKDGGYDVSDFKQVDPKFGTIKDFDSLIKKAHKLNIKIIVDLVAGHASEKNKYFLKSAEPTRNKYSDLFIWNNSVWDMENGYRLISGRYNRDACYLVNFFSTQPALNYGFKDICYPSWQMSYKDERTFQARHFMIDVMRFWLNRGADGFRVDMADSLVKNDEDKSATIEVWNYMFDIIKKEYPNSFFVSEWSSPWRSFKAGFDCDFVLSTHTNVFMHFFGRTSFNESVFNNANIEKFINDLKDSYNAAKHFNKQLGIISGNHDCIRLASINGEKELRLIYLLIFSLPGIPFIYYGDEIAMKHSPLTSKDGGYHRTGSRTPMQWNIAQKNAGFSNYDGELYLPVLLGDTSNVNSSIKDKSSIYYLIKDLIKIRKEHFDLKTNEIEIKYENKILFIYRCELTLIINLSTTPFNINDEIIYTLGRESIINYLEGAIIKKWKN